MKAFPNLQRKDALYGQDSDADNFTFQKGYRHQKPAIKGAGETLITENHVWRSCCYPSPGAFLAFGFSYHYFIHMKLFC